ncbi:MAG: hypothetical protein IPO71_01040 [Nitrosomonas sp.]|nr:hypothetical protein [Nitrosomonas sp.]
MSFITANIDNPEVILMSHNNMALPLSILAILLVTIHWISVFIFKNWVWIRTN